MKTIKLSRLQFEELSYQYHIDIEGKKLGDILNMQLKANELTIPVENVDQLAWRIDHYMRAARDNGDIGAYNMYRNLLKKVIS